MTSIRKSLLQFTFAGSFMKRWNDKLRPMELIELDKQAHKMIAAWALYELNSQHLPHDERIELGRVVVEGGIFDYMYRLIITDVKPPIFYQIKANPEHYAMLTEWVLEQLEPRVQPLGDEFWERITNYLRKTEADGLEGLGRRILAAAHLYASNWEFELIKRLSPQDEELEEIDRSFQDGLEAHKDLIGVEELMRGPASTLGKFCHLCGQLRFQKRWSQTPRIPETSVIGHMFLVACYGTFFSMAVDACPARLVNNFFSGLFHDMPELLTRDIISPVKKSVSHISELISEYERKELNRRVLEPLRNANREQLAERLSYFLGLTVGSEFRACIMEDGVPRAVTDEELETVYNQDRFDPKDGSMLKVCDTLAAFIEAYTALRNGISSDELQQGLFRMRQKYAKTVIGSGKIHVGALLADFD
ncbi:HD domain-containing protein [Oceanidesulfovibrio marinus]|uniref:HD domain-containing protein n=1 Tax=Oceanidesulfovibrio marinus TaxID=370038 RepID=A0A6P1ZL83_9BACT|nr:HD domain-containing protein [Oceanidesulfovibrio marinus]QJT08878.1 HD domain-containing protein [Oceanidesulfovibrio marinus]TVM36701.1 phosphohydrolase [Oceanidesulfovibrio marinus]